MCIVTIEKYKNKTKKLIADHFISEEVSKSTISSILKRQESRSDYIIRIRSDRPAKIFNKVFFFNLRV